MFVNPSLKWAAWTVAGLLVLAWQAPSAQQPVDSASIKGRVIDTGSLKPVADVSISMEGSGRKFPPVRTDSQGQFQFDSVPAGSYSLSTSKLGFLPGAYGQAWAGGPAGRITVRGAQIANVTLRVWQVASASGVVLSDAGNPLPRVTVRAYRRTAVAGRFRGTAVGQGMTDDRGTYRITGLTPGDYYLGVTSYYVTVPELGVGDLRADTFVSEGTILMASPPSRANSLLVGSQLVWSSSDVLKPTVTGASLEAFPHVFYGQAGSRSPALAVSLSSGDERTGLDLTMKRVAGANISGRLTFPDGPVPPTAIRLVRMASDGTDGMAAVSISDAGGRFTFLGVPPGEYSLRAQRFGLAPTETIKNSNAYWAVAPISVGNSDIANLVLPVRVGIVLDGEVVLEDLGRPQPAVQMSTLRIRAEAADGRALAPGFSTSSVDKDMAFKIAGLPEGNYFVRIMGQPDGWFLDSATVGGRDVSDVPFAASENNKVRVVLTRTPATLSGVVRDSQGATAPEAVVLVFPVSKDGWSNFGLNPRRIRTATSGPDGVFDLLGLPSGDYHAIAVAPGSVSADWAEPEMLGRLAARSSRVTVLKAPQRTSVNLAMTSAR